MSALEKFRAVFPRASSGVLGKLKVVHEALLQCDQAVIPMDHTIHGGMYVRTISVEAGIVVMGAVVRVPSVLIIEGSVSVLAGDEQVELEGFSVIHGEAGRQQLFVTRSPVKMTMIAATTAKTVTEAENEVFEDANMLMSRKGL